MTMKKRFLGLALAAMVAVPATTAYANGKTQTIEGLESEAKSATISVSGTIRNKEGQAPAGKIQVELPTAMAFTVDENSTLTGATYEVNNRSSVPITLSVADFRNSKGNITVKEADTFNPSAVDRSNVVLSLDGRVGNIPTSVDLGGFLADDAGTEIEVLDVPASDIGSISLTGEAGTKDSSNLPSREVTGVDKDGASGEFSLVFKIRKDTSL